MIATAAIAEQRDRAAKGKGDGRVTGHRLTARDLEGPVHRSVLRYLRLTLPHGWIVTHVANKPRSRTQGGKEKALGATAGWPDLQILGPGPKGPSVWFMEIKAPGGKLSSDQRELHDELMLAGFGVRIVRSVEDARKAVSDWRLPSSDSLIVRREA